jgi:hypothetical protein
MINGDHTLIPVAIVVMPDGSQRLQLTRTDNGKWSHLKLSPKTANSLREHLGLAVIATEPCYTGNEEPLRGFP